MVLHSTKESHPEVEKNAPLPFISVILLEPVKKETRRLFEREQRWQSNLGTIILALKKRKDIITITMQKSGFSLN